MKSLPIHTRREWLARGLGLVGVGAAVPQFLVRSALAASKGAADGRIVVSLLLTGGPDGLNVVPPHGHEEYFKLRENIGVPEKEIIPLNDEVGLHPQLAGFKALHDAGRLALVLGTAYPNQNMSHFATRRVWQKGRRGGSTGWLGRYLDCCFPDNSSPTLNVAVGPGRFPTILAGKSHAGVGFASPDSFAFQGLPSAEERKLYRQLNDATSAPDESDLAYLTRTAVNANTASERLREMAGGYATPVSYPDTQFGNSVRTIAGFINGGLDARAFFAAQGIAKFGGYDTHSDEPRRLGVLLKELSDTVTAFYQDLDRCGNAERVLTFTFSEFGRRVPENYSGGTDHGNAQPMFLFGPGLKAGVHGKQPSLSELDKNNNLKMEVDCRRVYAAVLKKWLSAPDKAILGKEFAPVDCVA